MNSEVKRWFFLVLEHPARPRIATLEIHRLSGAPHVDPREAPRRHRKETVRSRVFLRPRREALVLISPANVHSAFSRQFGMGRP
ncbi:MAG: hypothetical protein LC126_21770 [Bryobacterales bacterium]|nr:hypothetical protein [Bryobacterales bacterium]